MILGAGTPACNCSLTIFMILHRWWWNVSCLKLHRSESEHPWHVV